jgi:hypothetical protein
VVTRQALSGRLTVPNGKTNQSTQVEAPVPHQF